MSQKTNLNVSPFYDDFNEDNNFYKVLFKSGVPVQSRELTTIQSVLQNQISSFANHIFKDGSVVIPGGVSYNPLYYAVKINPTHLGLNVGLYIKELIGKTISGQTSGIKAIVVNVITDFESELGFYTLYVKYITGNSSFQNSQFINNETLITQDTFVYGNTTINSGETVATLISSNATSIASSVSIENGIYYLRGTFVKVKENTLILDQYSNTPSYRVGLSINEEIIDASADNSLYDNARGFPNFSAPGADRLKISAVLSKKSINDFDDTNFVEILRVNKGVVKKVQDTDNYSLIKEYIAKRTYEESGNYAVDQFNVEINESLNDKISTNGLFFNNEITEEGNTPSENLMCVKISPGKAYVKGFDIEKTGTTIIDVEKPRDVETINSSSVPFEMGNLLLVNNVSGTPYIGINNNYTIDLHNQRKSSNTVGSGKTIGKARVYSFSLSNSEYLNPSSQWDLYLFDIQTYTTLTLNSGVFCPDTSYIKGLSSGASGFAVQSSSNGIITVSQTSGSFIVGEQVTVNGLTDQNRSIVSIKEYNTEDIKSVFQSNTITGLSTSFAADTVLQRRIGSNFNSTDTLSITSSGIASCAGRNFIGISSDSIIKYQRVGFITETFNRVESVSTDGLLLRLSGVSSVSGVCEGGLPTSNIEVTFSFGVPSVLNETDSHLYTQLNDSNISDINLSSSDLIINKQITGKSTNSVGTLSLSLADVGVTSSFFEPFDVERYSVFYSDGSIQNLNSSNFSLSLSSSVVTIAGLLPGVSNVTVNSTVKKNSIVSKQKNYTRSEKLYVTKTISGVSTAISGLTTSNYYGLRVEDKEISLNVADVAKVIAVYESITNSTPSLDKLTFSSGLNLDSSCILGEKIVGQTSKAVAQIVTRLSTTEIEFVYLNSNTFINGETVNFQESNISSSIQLVTKGLYLNKTQDFILDKGHREQYYDYSRIIRKDNTSIPSRNLVIIYDYYDVSPSSSGDLYTVKSYDAERYKNDIPIVGENVRSTDILDFRPRVSRFGSTTSSPFAFSSRNFSSTGANPSWIIAPNETSTVSYSKYLPRIDKVVLNKNGNISVIKGTSSANPKEPKSTEDSMDIATINLPAYLYSTSAAKIIFADNKRYTMRDIQKLEDRITNLEQVSALTLLEIDTKSLQIQDSDGLSRFKSGFFADGFKDTSFIDLNDTSSKFSINKSSEVFTSDISAYSLKSQISILSSLDTNVADFSSNLNLTDTNVKKTGDLVTLNYAEIEWSDLSQNFATTDQQINPSSVVNYNGNLRLRPSSDTWCRTILSDSGAIVRSEGDWSNSYLSNLITGGEYSSYMRSRNVEFFASGMQPSTRYYGFLDGNSNIDVVPKLLQISMVSGTFQVGEDVIGYNGDSQICCFRVANQNHKYGSYNAPSETYSENPYLPASPLGSYSSSSTVLNIDTYSLSEDFYGKYFGYAPAGITLIGKTSGAQASVQSQSLISDSVGDLIGCFYIRNPLSTPTPPVLIEKGSKTFKLSSSQTASTSLTVNYTQSTFSSSGIVNSSTYTESIVVRKPPAALPLNALRRDPLSQTFRTDNEGGFLTSIDLYFSDKDSNEKLFVEIRETELGGVPKNKLIQDFARAEVLPSQITTSSDGTVATNIKFRSPIYLEPNKQYAITLLCPSSSTYKVWVAETNNPTVATSLLPAVNQVIYSNNYSGGYLFKPQNGSVWLNSLTEDLKFKLYKASFAQTSGTLYLNNPSLSDNVNYGNYDKNINNLTNNPIKAFPRKLVVGIVTSNNISQILSSGTKILWDSNINYGYVEKTGGNINSNGSGITTSNVGIGYSSGTFTSVPLYTITGSGSGATANIVFNSDSEISTVSIASSGNGYSVGDILGITTSFVGGRGYGGRISVSNVSNVDTIYLTNVNGSLALSGQTLSYYNGNTNVSLSGTTVRGESYIPSDLYSGNVFEIYQYNHGMHSDNNIVSIKGVFPDTTPEPLTASIDSSSTLISVANTSQFLLYEGETVTGIYTGYVLINNEIISYNSVGSNSLTINRREESESLSRNHSIGDLVYKYEVSGVSLNRINTSHNLPSNNTLKSLRGIDNYHLEFNRGGNGNLSFVDQRVVGGSNCFATKNYQFDSIIPQFNFIAPDKTSVSSTLRTISGTSCNGNEISFLDQGFESIELNTVNNFTTPRLVCSRINESNRLGSNFLNNKSLTLAITLNSSSPNVSPVIDLSDSATFVLLRNRINKPISNYISDSGSNENNLDPHQTVYVSKKVTLKNPASSLKVIISAYRDESSDFRVLYKLYKADSSEITQAYRLFPGYRNLLDTNGDGIGDRIIDISLNDGSSDKFVRPSINDEFLEYQFTAEDIEQFSAFKIKVVLNGTNESKPPIFSDIRAIALA